MARRYIQRGAILFGIGVAITVGSFALSTHTGGIFIVSFGPMIFGAIYLVQGGIAWSKFKGQPEAGAGPVGQHPIYPPPPGPAYPPAPKNWQPPASGWRPPGR